MRSIIISAAAIIGFSAGPTFAQDVDLTRFWDGSAEDLVRIRRAVAEDLRDPDSAYFRDVEARKITGRDNDVYVICGSVSGRNGYGGMGQPQLFYYTDRVTILPQQSSRGETERAQSGIATQIWNVVCRGHSELFRELDWQGTDDQATPTELP